MKSSSLSIRDIAILIGAVIAFAFLSMSDERSPLASAETRFVEYSETGLQVVPASCASVPDMIPEQWEGLFDGWFGTDYEHFSGECSDPDDPDNPDGPDDPDGPGNPPGGNPPSQPTGPGNTCPIGYTLCIGSQCSEQNYGRCVYSGCPEGYRLEGNQCVPNTTGNQCGGYFCSGSDLYERYSSGNQCLSRLNRPCAFGCSGGGCLAAPPGDGNITVSPALIRSGERTTVTWSTNGMLEDSCTVVANNPDINDSSSGLSGSFTSSIIRQQTTYTLTCTREDESTFHDSATVNIIPNWIED